MTTDAQDRIDNEANKDTQTESTSLATSTSKEAPHVAPLEQSPAETSALPVSEITPPLPLLNTTSVRDTQNVLNDEDARIYATLKARRSEMRHKKTKKRSLLIAALAVFIVLGFLAVYFLSKAPQEEAELISDTVVVGTYRTEIQAQGELQALSSSVVEPEVEGTITEVKVTLGQEVAEGDVLFTITSESLDEALESALEALNTAKAEQRSAYDTYNQAVDVYNAAIDAGRDPGDVPDKSPLSASDEAVASAQNTYNKVLADVEDKRAIKAQSAGTIISLAAQVGAQVGTTSSDATSPLVQIADLSQLKVRIQVGEEDIAKVAQGQVAYISFPAFDDLSLEGSVVNIASIASLTGDVYDNGYAAVSYDVDILIPEPDERLKLGMTADVSLEIEKIEDATMVPLSGLLTDDGESYYVQLQADADTQSYTRVDVELVTQNDEYAVVKGSLDDGDVLIISGGVAQDADVSAASDVSSTISLGAWSRAWI